MTCYKAFDSTVFPDDPGKLVCSGNNYRKVYHVGKRHYA